MMLGRAAYQDSSLLAAVDGQVPHPLTGAPALALTVRDADFWRGVCAAMQAHAARHIERGGRLIHVTRHMVGLFQGLAGAKRYRQILSSEAARTDAGPEVIARAFEAVLVRMEAGEADDADGGTAVVSA